MSAPAPIAGGPTAADGPALGLLELATVARGVVVADAALKRAPAVLLSSRTLSGGKLLVVLAGGVAEVEEAMAAGKLAAGDRLRDRVELAYADAQVWPMLAAARLVVPGHMAADAAPDALAIVQAFAEDLRTTSPDLRPSILQDADRGRRLEVNETLGYSLTLAQRFGLPAPTLDLCCRVLRVVSRAAR